MQRLGESDLDPSSPKTPAVSYCYVYVNNMLTMESTKSYSIYLYTELYQIKKIDQMI